MTAAVFSELGNSVYCVGRTKKKIDNLKNGIMPFYEPGLAEVVKRNVKAKRLNFTLSYQEAVRETDIIFICVGTPSKENGETDLSQVYSAASEIGKNLKGYTVVACKSTVPVGTNLKIRELIKKISTKKLNNSIKFDVASCPEFLREGTALSDTLHPDRIVIGFESEKAGKILLELHKPIQGARVLTDIATAEMIKYVSNALLATKISFANSIAFICDKIGADVEKVLEGVGLDRRLGRAFLYPGVGYGGSCFPKDVKSLIAQAKSVGIDYKLLKSVQEVNKEAADFFVNKILKESSLNSNSTIGILGLAFKPDTDDMREAPSIKIIKSLQQKNLKKIQAYDPQATENAKLLLNNVDFVNNPYAAARGASALLIITEWNEFRQLDLVKIKQLMKNPIIFDGRNIYEPDKIRELGFKHISVGRS